MLRFIPLLWAISLVVAGCGPNGERPQERSALLVDEQFVIEAVTARELLEEVRRLDSDVVIVNFWATWCAPCREEFPDFIRFDQQHDDVAVRFVSVDIDDDIEFVAAFLREHDLRGPTFLQSGADGAFVGSVSSDWIGTIPATAIYDGDGTQLDFWEGKVSYDELADRVERARTRS